MQRTTPFYPPTSVPPHFIPLPAYHPYFLPITILLTKTTARKYSPRTQWYLSATSFCAAVVFVRGILICCCNINTGTDICNCNAFIWNIIAQVLSYQLKLIKMRANLGNLSDCAVPLLSRAATNLCWYYYTWAVTLTHNQTYEDIIHVWRHYPVL